MNLTSNVSDLFPTLQNTPDNFVAGKITECSENWTHLTSDKTILSTVLNGFEIQFESNPCQFCSRSEISFNDHEQEIIDKLLEKFLDKNIVEISTHEQGEVISNIFIRPKPDGTHRLILNLSSLNEHIEHIHFKMETFKSALHLVQRNCYFAKIDLKDAYYSVPIALTSRKYLKFTWRGILLQFTCLANGLSSAPRAYTKLMKPVFSSLRKDGHLNVSYIDDSLLQSETFDMCKVNVQDTMTLMDSLGLTVHPEKSIFIPSQIIEFVGYIINSVDMTVRLPTRKANDIIQQCKTFLSKDEITIREFAQLIGKLVASEPAVLYAPLYYKSLEIQKDTELKKSRGNFDHYMTLSELSIQCLQWWISNVATASKPIIWGKPNRIIESDSSGTGYGARDVTYTQDISGVWDEEEKLHHINFLELKAAFLALKGLCSNVNNEHVQLFLDNTTAIKYLSKMGGRKTDLNQLTREIWCWCRQRNIFLSVFFIPGRLNVHADALSRQKLNKDMEWMLNKAIFDKIMGKYGPCNVDMFASKANHQISPYVSYLPDVNALAINAFSLNWADYKSYIFSPFSVLGTVLQKLEEEQAEAVVIAPIFTTQPWFPKLLQMTVTIPSILPKSKHLLTQPNTQMTHPLNKMSLGVFKVSGKKCATRVFHRSLPESLCRPGDRVHRNNMGHISRSGCDFVVKGKLLHLNHL